jgi:hypothetical protein
MSSASSSFIETAVRTSMKMRQSLSVNDAQTMAQGVMFVYNLIAAEHSSRIRAKFVTSTWKSIALQVMLLSTRPITHAIPLETTKSLPIESVTYMSGNSSILNTLSLFQNEV